jgi:hypothetical protein
MEFDLPCYAAHRLPNSAWIVRAPTGDRANPVAKKDIWRCLVRVKESSVKNIVAIALACVMVTPAMAFNAFELAVVIASAGPCKFRIYDNAMGTAANSLATPDNPTGVMMLHRNVEEDRATIAAMSPEELAMHCKIVSEFAGAHGLIQP